MAYGHDRMSTETRDTLLHGQLQEGLRHELMRAPGVSGAQTYQELCLASRNEEKRLAELRKRQQYQRPVVGPAPQRPMKKIAEPKAAESVLSKAMSAEPCRCYQCHQVGHFARDCTLKRTESGGRKDSRSGTNQVRSEQELANEVEQFDLLDILYSSDEEKEAEVSVVEVRDHGSHPQCARVEIQGVLVFGVIDSGADITIIGGNLLRRVASVAKLRKKDLKPADKVPRNYDQRPFTLHGRMDLDISFAGKTMTTPVYIKMDAKEQLLLSEGVCRQLSIIQYHPDVQPWRSREKKPAASAVGDGNAAEEQRKDPRVFEVIHLLESGELPADEQRARKLALQENLYVVVDGVLYHLDPKQTGSKRAVVPQHLREQVMEQSHRGPMAGHFSGHRLFNTLSRHWWWEGMYGDTRQYVKSCPECAIVSGGGRVQRPPLHPIPVSRPFQIIGVDVMDLPKTAQGNKHVLVFQDLFTKWPMVFAIPDQKTDRIVRILVDEIVPFCGVPEALLSDRGTNLLSHMMLETCELLGTKKLNTTAYHPQCDGLVKRYNRTLKTALRKHAARFGVQWDRLLSGVVWAYRNTPHEATQEKPSYLLFGLDCRTPTEAAMLPPSAVQLTEVSTYREELTVSLTSARELAASSIRQAQKKYKKCYDRKVVRRDYRVGDWVLVRFPHEETGKGRKLSRPWHGPYRVVEANEPDVTVVKVFRPQDGKIQIHQTRVTPCPPAFNSRLLLVRR